MSLDKQDHRSLVLWAADCAEHVLPYFEEKYPKDNRPRNALEAGRAWVRGEIAMSEARAAGHAAATAHVGTRAAHAANYAVRAATERLRTRSTRLSAISAEESSQRDQASQVAARGLVLAPPSPTGLLLRTQ